MKDKIKLSKNDLESFCLDDVLRMVKERKKKRKERKALDKEKKHKKED